MHRSVGGIYSSLQAPTMTIAQPHLPIARYRLHFTALETVRLPHYAGSTWRGALGHSLKRSVCVTQLPQCAPCPLVHVCAYAWLFETPPPLGTEKMRKYPAVPHPFVVNPQVGEVHLEAGEPYALELNLIGHGNRYLPYLLHGLERAGRQGVGKGMACMRLESVEREVQVGSGNLQRIYCRGGPIDNAPAAAPPVPLLSSEVVRIDLLTPLRLRREGRPVRPDAFRFVDLFTSLLRRVSMLTYFHTDHPLETDFAGLTQKAREVEWNDSQMVWRSWNRYSSRQGREVAMDGLMGYLVLPAQDLAPFWPYLWLGQFIHAGAGTSMGQGRLRVEPLADDGH
jgi:hypothetical protein